jgi:hypothetical protein
MAPPTRIEEPVQLLVEGKDVKNFFEIFIRHVAVPNAVQIQDFGGVKELRRFLGSFVKSPGFERVESIGIVRDAEQSATGARQSVQDSLRHAGLPMPGEAGGSDGLAVKVLILPGGEEERGMLETLLCRSVADDPVNGCIETFFDCVGSVPGTEIRRPDKARAQAYLATRPVPQISVGVAAREGYWPLDHHAFAEVRDFLAGL